MTENTKKWLTVAGCLVVCAILVAVIASSFSKDKVTDDLLPPSSSQQGDVVVDPDSSTPPPAESGDDQKPGDSGLPRPIGSARRGGLPQTSPVFLSSGFAGTRPVWACRFDNFCRTP